jgi:3-methyl-2-oxobutanoate hydroxymethyltransferase
MVKQKTTEKVTTYAIREMKKKKERIAMLTAYDYASAGILDESGIDIILVGDSLGMVVLGYETTLSVTMDEMIHHTKAVCRATHRAMVVGDMPFLSYQVSPDEAIYNAGRFLQEAGAHGVKIEGGREMAEITKRISSVGIPVMAHIGLTPQSVHQFGGYRPQGKEKESAKRILEDARILEEAGAFAIVLECVPAALAKKITQTLTIPTIGIGAGADCDGQVLVINDMLGMFERFTPRFVKKYANLNKEMKKAIRLYSDEVKAGIFPAEEHSF